MYIAYTYIYIEHMHIYSNYYIPYKSSTDSLPSELSGKPESSALFCVCVYFFSPSFLPPTFWMKIDIDMKTRICSTMYVGAYG